MRLREGDRVEPPYSWHALEVMLAAIFEGEARPYDGIPDVLDTSTSPDAARGESRDDRDSGDFLAYDLALARVDAGTRL